MPLKKYAFAAMLTAATSSFAHAMEVRLGGFVGDGGTIAQIRNFETRTGKRLEIVMRYIAWDQGFPTDWAAQIGKRRASIAWMPWDYTKPASDTTYSLDKIAAGEFDDYIRQWAKDSKAYGKRYYMRFAHEMNGDWYPWGQKPSAYVKAWRHVHGIFRQEGATNVVWVWSPNNTPAGTLNQYYPGDAYVDWVGLDGYNWGESQSWSNWQSFAQVFGPTYRETARITAKPLMIAETASTEVGDNKARWIRDMASSLANFPRIKALVWFDIDKETDWRVNSSARALRAFRDIPL